MKNLLLAVVAIGLIYYGYIKYQEKHSWTLIVCKDRMANSVECDNTSYEIPGYKSSKECLLDGTVRFSKEGFECGGGCRKELGDINACEEICNISGCSK